MLVGERFAYFDGKDYNIYLFIYATMSKGLNVNRAILRCEQWGDFVFHLFLWIEIDLCYVLWCNLLQHP